MTVNATWSRSLGPITILAFCDRRYTVSLGSGSKPPVVEIGWARWRPNSINFPRSRRQ